MAETLKLVDELNIKTKIKIIGIQPQNVDFGDGLSDEIKNQNPTNFKTNQTKRSMNTQTTILLLLSALSVGFIHTLFGPDHYVPFIVLAKSRSGQ